MEQLDSLFTKDEVIKAISELKRGKSRGIDCLIPEMFIECKILLAPMLCRLFNPMFVSCIYPESWTKGVIVPVPKKGNQNDVNNYRGISLTSIFSKIFSTILNTRLRICAESHNLLSDFQFGFRKSKSTVDCIFVLTSIIERVISYEKKKLYCAFVDFVYRNGIWFKLLQCGASSKIVNMLQKMYEQVKCCVRVNCEYSDYFESTKGVKQGEPLSPLQFLFFINDMQQCINDNYIDSLCVNELKIFLLLFADDTVLMSF